MCKFGATGVTSTYMVNIKYKLIVSIVN